MELEEVELNDEGNWLYRPFFSSAWPKVRLTSLARWINGMAFRDFQFTERGRPIIKIAEIKNGISGQTKFTQSNYESIYLIHSGDLLFSWSGQPETSIDAFWWRGPDGWLNQHVFKVVPNEALVSQQFLYYLLKYLNPNFVSIARNKQTTGLGHVTKADIAAIEVGVPSFEEQQAIVDKISSIDRKIELNRQINQTLEQMAQALFQCWFVDFEPVKAKVAALAEGRDPLRAAMSTLSGKTDDELGGMTPEAFEALAGTAALFPNEMEESVLGMVPSGWKVKRFSETVHIHGGGTPKTSRPDFWNGDIPWFSVVDAPSDYDVFTIDTEKKITQSGLNSSSARLLPEGTTVISARGTVGKLALTGVPMVINQSCYGVSGKEAGSFFTYFSVRSIVVELKQRTHGSVFDTITRETLSSLNVVAPPELALSKFEAFVEPAMRQIKANLEQATILAVLRDSLLPKMLSGELGIVPGESADA